MTLDRNDPRLTAYALGELTEDERRAFEAELAEAPELARELEQIRATATLLSAELGRDAPQALGRERHATIADAARHAPRDVEVPSLRPRRLRPVRLFAAASALTALAAGALLFVSTGRQAPSTAEDSALAKGAPAVALVSAASPAAEMARGDVAGKPAGAKAKQGGPGEVLAPDFNTESYDHFTDNPFVLVAQDPRSTFSVDVDTAGYSLVRRHLTDGALPPPGAVRIEELLNYFKYDYPEPTTDVPFSVNTEVSAAPWAPTHQLLRIGIKGKHVDAAARPRANLVFLLDVSGSMESPDKLPLLKQGFRLLVNQLDAGDRVSIAVYAGASGLVLPPTPGSDKRTILDALDRLEAGGSTNGAEGIQLAYAQARAAFTPGGANRVILATDGDFNVGTTSQDELVRLIEEQAKSGVFLSVLGFGSGNYKDSTLEKLADKGNGNYAYIDSASEARKVLVEQAAGTLLTIAKDVKIQLEMNPTQVAAFRLIGYENRALAHQDFTNDQKDAGEIGADHTVTALYELVPKGEAVPGGDAGPLLRYQAPAAPTDAAHTNELLTVKLRYKLPTGDVSREVQLPVSTRSVPFANASRDHQFAAAVAAFGMLLRNSEHKGSASYASVAELAQANAGDDPYRRELVTLVRRADELAP